MRIEVDQNGEITEHEDAPIIVPTLEQTKIKRITEIDIRLDEIDRLTIRSLRSINRGRGTAQDDTKMTDLDNEAESLRLERTTLV